MAEEETKDPAPVSNGEGTEEEEEDEEEEEEEESSEEEPQPARPKEKSKFELLHEFLKTTNDFLEQFNGMVENQAKHRSLYLRHLNPLRETLVVLLLRFIQNHLPRDDYLYQHIMCGGAQSEPFNNEEFEKHYVLVHEKDNGGISLPQFDDIDTYHEVVKDYIVQGKVVSQDLLYRLRRILRKINMVQGDHTADPCPVVDVPVVEGEEKAE